MARILFALLLAPLLIGAAPVEGQLFGKCASGPRVTCVVDGDTFWLDGTKIRVADINTPETSRPGCPQEAALGRRATARFIELLNGGPFELGAYGSRDADRYGRKLRVVLRGGRSLGGVLVAEGLAEPWTGRRSDWCAAGQLPPA